MQIRPKSEFSRNILTLITGTTIAQAIPIVISPILTRIYTPEDFGIFAVYIAIYAIFISLASLRYELAIPLPISNRKASNVVALSGSILLFMVMLLSSVLYFFGNFIVDYLNIYKAEEYLWFLPVAVLFGGFYQIFSFWAIRTKSFNVIAKTKIRQSMATIGMHLVLFKFGFIGLILGHASGQGVGIISLVNNAIKKIKFGFIKWYIIKKVAKQYKKFPIYSSFAALLNNLNNHLPIILITAYGSVGIAGLLMLGQRILGMPISILSTSISQAIHKDLAEAKQYNKVGEKTIILVELLLKLSIAPAVLIILFAPTLTGVVFGDEWIEAGIMISYLTPFYMMTFIFSPMSTVISVMEWQKYGLIYQILSFVISLSILTFFLVNYTPLFTILAYSIVRLILIVIYRSIMFYCLDINILNLLKILLINVFLFFIYGMTLIVLLEDLFIMAMIFVIILFIVTYIYINRNILRRNKLCTKIEL